MKNALLLVSLFAVCRSRADLVTTFDEAALPAAVLLDIPNATLGNVVFDAVNRKFPPATSFGTAQSPSG